METENAQLIKLSTTSLLLYETEIENLQKELQKSKSTITSSRPCYQQSASMEISDNKNLCQAILLKFEEGDFQFNKENQLNTKKQGLSNIMDGMKLLQQLINSETGAQQENLKQIYKRRYEEILNQLKLLENYQKIGKI